MKQQSSPAMLPTIRILSLLFVTSVVVSVLTACASAKVHDNSFLAPEAKDQHLAKVYILRAKPVKFKGVADSRIVVDINGAPLVSIDEGAYTLVKIKPAKAKITTHSKTKFTTQFKPINVTRTREYNFIAGKTYFINLDRVNEEFRGIFYDPAPVTLEQARKIAEPLRPVGQARSEQIKDIKKVATAPRAGSLKPALPEELYPGKPYLIKGTPKYEPPKQPEGKNEITFDQPPEAETETSPGTR